MGIADSMTVNTTPMAKARFLSYHMTLSVANCGLWASWRNSGGQKDQKHFWSRAVGTWVTARIEPILTKLRIFVHLADVISNGTMVFNRVGAGAEYLSLVHWNQKSFLPHCSHNAAVGRHFYGMICLAIIITIVITIIIIIVISASSTLSLSLVQLNRLDESKLHARQSRNSG